LNLHALRHSHLKAACIPISPLTLFETWWLLPDSNWGHKALQASALPTELKSHTHRTFYNNYLYKQNIDAKAYYRYNTAIG
jgi:hypothetical protein